MPTIYSTAKAAVTAAMLIAGAVAAVPAFAQANPGTGDYRNQKFGFSLKIPVDFVPAEAANPEFGAMWLSPDGKARLVAVAAPNEGNETLQSYRAFVIEQSYKTATFDYTPMRDNWFVLSGVRDGRMFYERVMFVCEGRYIYGWQMIYPFEERRRYDRIAEAIHRSYRPGRGPGGNCS